MTETTTSQQEQPFRLYVGNVSYDTTDDQLRAVFAGCAGVTDVAIAMRRVRRLSNKNRRREEGDDQEEVEAAEVEQEEKPLRSRGYGFVTFSSKETMLAAMEKTDGQELDGRTLNVKEARPPRAEGEAEQAGEQGEKKARRRPRKKAPKTAENGEAAPADAAEQGGEKKERRPRAPRREKVPLDQRSPSTTTVFVSNLPFSYTADELEKLVSELKIGGVVKATIAERRFKNGDRRSKGFGFVEFAEEKEQKRAVELLSGKEVDGRTITVKVAMDRPVNEEDAAAAEE